MKRVPSGICKGVVLAAAVALIGAGCATSTTTHTSVSNTTVVLSSEGLPIGSGNVEGYGLRIYKVESGLYPFVQVYFRTFDLRMQPLVNLNYSNVGVMVQGRPLDPTKKQYAIQTLRNMGQAVRTVVVLDCSTSMMVDRFLRAREAVARFCDSKRPQDQVAIIAVRGPSGFEIVSNWERDAAALGRRLADVQCDAPTTRLYDAIAGAMQMCGTVPQGGAVSNEAEYIISSSIVVLSDGEDDGSALSRGDLMGRITNLPVPIPIYSLAYSGNPNSYLNLEALSKDSFGAYYSIWEHVEYLQRCVENIQYILQNDYVITLRSPLPVDGMNHAVKIGVEYPSGTGKFTYQSSQFEAVDMSAIRNPVLDDMRGKLNAALPPLPAGVSAYLN